LIFLLELLGFLERAFEGLSVTENECFFDDFFGGCLGQLEWFIAMATVVRMMFLKLANICFPAEI